MEKMRKFKKRYLGWCILIVIFVFLLSGCLGVEKSILLPEDSHIKFNYLDGDRIEYQDNTYYLSPLILYQNTKDIQYLGWSGSRFWSKNSVYCDTTDNPTFLYLAEDRMTYLKEDFDYKSAVFSIEGTEEVIIFEENLLENNRKVTESYDCKIIISSIDCIELKVILYVYNEGNEWYASSYNMTTFKLSDNFVYLLKQNRLIEYN